MARQKGGNILQGKMGGISYYNSKYGPLARTIGKISKERFENDPKLAARRDATREFGYASNIGKLIRLGVRWCCPDIESR